MLFEDDPLVTISSEKMEDGMLLYSRHFDEHSAYEMIAKIKPYVSQINLVISTPNVYHPLTTEFKLYILERDVDNLISATEKKGD